MVLLRGIAVDREEFFGRQAEEPTRLLVQRLPDLFRRQFDVFVFVGQPFGPRFDGGCHRVYLGMPIDRIARVGWVSCWGRSER